MSEYGGRTFDRLVEFDERSRAFPVTTVLDIELPLRSYTWSCAAHLDQGREGACVGFGWAAELAARPSVVPRITNDVGRAIYHAAQRVDEWPGEDYEGTSVLAGAKVTVKTGYVNEYRWCFTLNDVLRTIGYKGPVVLGVPWYGGMMDTDAAGLIHPTGTQVGGHCILANGVSVPKKLVRLHNSWSVDWGVFGDAFITWDDLGMLLDDDGDACVPLLRDLTGILPT